MAVTAVVASTASLIGCQSSTKDAGDSARHSTIAYVRSISVSGFTDGPFIGEILVMRRDGRGKTNLTHNRAGTEDGNPTWSPDAAVIAFTRVNRGPPAIYVVGADGGGLRRLVENASSPTWSPDGTRIAFVGAPWDSSSISIVGSDGTGQRELVGSGRHADDPAWSPDGQTIAFVGLDSASNGDGTAMWSVAADGGTPQKLLERVDVGRFEWSPDGEDLAFVRRAGGDRNEVGIVSADGTDVRRVAIFHGFVSGASWAPDGRKLAVATHEGIFVVTVDGQRKALTRHPDQSVTWSPDGRELAFVRYPNIATIDADGGPVRLLTDRPEHWEPAWSP